MLQPQQVTGPMTVQTIDINSIMNLMIMLVVVVMMMKMMGKAFSEEEVKKQGGSTNPSGSHHSLEHIDERSFEQASRWADFVAEADLAMSVEIIPLVEEGKRDEAINKIDQTLRRVEKISKESNPELVDRYLFQIKYWLGNARNEIITQPDDEALRLYLDEISSTFYRLHGHCLIQAYLKSVKSKS